MLSLTLRRQTHSCHAHNAHTHPHPTHSTHIPTPNHTPTPTPNHTPRPTPTHSPFQASQDCKGCHVCELVLVQPKFLQARKSNKQVRLALSAQQQSSKGEGEGRREGRPRGEHGSYSNLVHGRQDYIPNSLPCQLHLYPLGSAHSQLATEMPVHQPTSNTAFPPSIQGAWHVATMWLKSIMPAAHWGVSTKGLDMSSGSTARLLPAN